jgi:flagellar biosynthetic protein FlhB
MWTLVKTLIKLTILVGVGYILLHSVIYGVMGSVILPLGSVLSKAQGSLFSIIRYIGVLALITAGIDYFFERRKYQKDMKMTKQEVKQEFREMEGSPEMKQARKNRARQMSRMQTMAALTGADVIVTNPTHYAVALIYDRERDGVPRVLAKGEDLIAFEMREKAIACGIPVVENPPLARTIYSACEVNQLIPHELYSAVAQLLAYVYSLTPTAKMFTKIHHMSNTN